ncbi:hypothetical protein EW026_g306 [Hermanssonia centrifuga]|uniref:Protein SirB1 N-terminal domain-containing protein n=1 Tax=Hermanssonia centrifuga TaxID=98765 RepID=A0A4S4KUY3_9APHY|nr:hypothetical protein EW026_g306 [Hermanssonia centrifuga]
MSSPCLPVEIYIEILKVLPTSKSDPAEHTLLSCLQASSVTRTAALCSVCWKTPYDVRYTHCVCENEKKRKEASGGDWRLMYIERRRLDRRALRLLDEIREERSGRHERVRCFTQYSFDVWDALKLESELNVPNYFGGLSEGPLPVNVPADALPRRYWAQAVLGVISRHSTLKRLAQVFTSPEGKNTSFEEALGALSSFFDVSPKEVTLQLDEIYAQCLETLSAENVPLSPGEPGYDFWFLCTQIRHSIHQLGFRLADGPQFYSVMNQFPHHFLSPGHRETIPMSLVYVYVAIARRLGINASPANFPGVVQVHIQPPDPREEPRLLDMRGTDEPVIFRYCGSSYGAAHSPASDEATRAATPDKMLTRAYNNIIMFMRYERVYAGGMSLPWSSEAHEAAFYATSCLMMLEAPNPQFMPSLPSSKPLDAVAVLQDVMAPALPPITRATVSGYCYSVMEEHEESAKNVSLRSAFPHVKYFVGLVMKHAICRAGEHLARFPI